MIRSLFLEGLDFFVFCIFAIQNSEMETLIINKATKTDLAKLVDYAREMGLDVKVLPKKESAGKLSSEEKKFLKMLKSGIKEAKEIREGKREGKPLQQVLDEL